MEIRAIREADVGAIALQLKNQSDRPWRWRLVQKGKSKKAEGRSKI